jgi:hypothetical protein
VREIFSPVLMRLDHQPPRELEVAADCDPASLALWTRQQVLHTLSQLDWIDF